MKKRENKLKEYLIKERQRIRREVILKGSFEIKRDDDMNDIEYTQSKSISLPTEINIDKFYEEKIKKEMV